MATTRDARAKMAATMTRMVQKVFYGERTRVGQVLGIFCEQIALHHAVRLECGFPTMCEEGAGLTEPDASASTNPNPTR
jgi:hypothetical protein